MFAHAAYKWVFGGLLAVALLGLPSCQSAPKEQPQAFTGQAEKKSPRKRSAVHRGAIGKGRPLLR